jgi:hypothetical protein
LTACYSFCGGRLKALSQSKFSKVWGEGFSALLAREYSNGESCKVLELELINFWTIYVQGWIHFSIPEASKSQCRHCRYNFHKNP